MPTDVRILDPLEALVQGPSRRTFRVGLALPMSGVLGMAGPSALEAALLAGMEINTLRTSAERKVEFVVLDSGGPADHVSGMVSELSSSGAVEAFVGLHTSRTREHVERALARRHVPYVFTAGHEAADLVPGLYCSGESPVQLMSGLARVMSERQVLDWAIVGTDYVWPRAMRRAARAVVESHSGRVVLDRLLPVGTVGATLEGVINDLTSSSAGGIIINMPGRDLTKTLLALRGRSLDQRLLRFSGGLEENVLYAINGDSSGNLYSTQHSFESLPSERRVELNARYRSAFGDHSPVLNSWAEHCYDGAHLVAALDTAGLLTSAALGAFDDPNTPPEALGIRPQYDIHLAVAAGMSFLVL
ncbi:ABC transporter substrate-binding protein [Pseudarthrobacter sp. NPDC058329]|uniref:ABC transporter substrate-binding protein n=1 Tax=Pseudarthrobacter sp. NPDC058329 TaxID=3346448 RepID=UPI0036DB9E2F